MGIGKLLLSLPNIKAKLHLVRTQIELPSNYIVCELICFLNRIHIFGGRQSVFTTHVYI